METVFRLDDWRRIWFEPNDRNYSKSFAISARMAPVTVEIAEQESVERLNRSLGEMEDVDNFIEKTKSMCPSHVPVTTRDVRRAQDKFAAFGDIFEQWTSSSYFNPETKWMN